MATLYVSNQATNDYRVGVNSGAGTTKATAWLTLDYTLNNVSNDDTIVINDGTYTAATFYNPSNTGLTINGENRHLTILKHGGAQSRVLHLQADTTNITIGEVVLDSENDAGSCVTDGAVSTGGINVTFSGTKFLNPTAQFFQLTRLSGLTMDSNWVAEASAITSYGFAIQHTTANDATAGTISLSDGTITINSIADVRGALVVASVDVAGVDFIASNLTIDVTGALIANEVRGIRSSGTQSTIIENCTITTNNTNLPNAIVVDNSAVDNCDSCRVSNNTITADAFSSSGGHGVQIGTDDATAPAARDSISNALTYGNTINNINHAIICGWITGSKTYNNLSNICAYGSILKGTTSGLSYGNVAIDPTITGLLLKGDTNGIQANNTVIYTSAAAGVSTSNAQLSEVSGVVNSTGGAFYNNVVITYTPIGRFAVVDATQTCSFQANNYWLATGGTVLANPYNYQGTGYANLAAWNAIGTSTDETEVDPEIVDISGGDYRADSGTLKATGFKWASNNPEGYGGEPFPSFDIDIGAVQGTDVTYHPFHPVNL